MQYNDFFWSEANSTPVVLCKANPGHRAVLSANSSLSNCCLLSLLPLFSTWPGLTNRLMTKKLATITIGIAMLAGGLYFLFNDPGTGQTPLQTMSSRIFSLPFLLVIAGLFASLYGLLGGVRFSKPVYLLIGASMFIAGASFVYGDTGMLQNGAQMRDVLFSPGIVLMGASLYIIIMTLLGKRI
ncbi:MAG: hypothetical protein PVF52_00335 [Granulosicoccaceae bacterium]